MAKKKAATKKKVNMSAAIKQYLADHPDAGPTEVSEALKKQGVHVTPTYVSNIKSELKSKSAKKKRATTKGRPKDTSPVEDFVQAGQLLFQAVDLVMKAGAKEAKVMVEMASKMVERITDEKK